MTVRILVVLTLLFLWVVPAYAQSEPFTIVSDPTTEWFNEETNTWQEAVVATRQSPRWPQIPGAQWIWNYPVATFDQKEFGDVVQFRRTFTLPQDLDGVGTFLATADNEVVAKLNGTEIIATTCDFNNSSGCVQEIPIHGQAGENNLEFTVTQYGVPGTGNQLDRNLAGLVFKATFETPAEDNPNPIVIVPGMIVPLNMRVTFGDAEEGGTWDFAPTTRQLYQGLLDRLAQQGFIEGENLFVAHYDWRKTISFSADRYLKPVINQAKRATGADTVDIIAHSMGGLVSRAYMQGASYDDDVDQLVTLGTPHLGAADAYLAWEGGQLPDRWSVGLKFYVSLVEFALRGENTSPLPRPLSFREFFPSLKDLLPAEQFVERLGSPLAMADMAADNLFMRFLVSTAERLTRHEISVTTVAGDSLPTLGTVAVGSDRSLIDIALQRWRDGHPTPDPPPTDTTAGDQTVLLSSAHFGSENTTLPNTEHDKLPEAAQNEVLTALGLDASGPLLTYDTPESLVGTVVLSPVTPSLTDPAGNTVTCDATKHSGNVYCTVDAEDANGPKLLVVADPEPGEYQLTLTGTDSGEYHAVTCFADADEDMCTQRAGVTQSGQVDTVTFAVHDNSITLPPEDIAGLLCQVRDAVRELKRHHMNPSASNLQGLSTALCNHGRQWQRAVERQGVTHKQSLQQYDKAVLSLNRFTQAFTTHARRGYLDYAAIQRLQELLDQIDL